MLDYNIETLRGQLSQKQQVSGPHPARPANYYRNLTRPGPWAAGRPGPRAEALPAKDTNADLFEHAVATTWLRI